MNPVKILAAILCAYLLGSIPTALIYSRMAHQRDIRELGDGNMGARNIKRAFGWRGGVLVALADIVKGTAAVILATLLAVPLEWQYAAGAFAILGHDFPVFAGFKGGQGFATTTGVFLALFPLLTLIGACLYAVLFFTTRSSDIGASIGMGFLAFAHLLTGGILLSTLYIVVLLLFIPFKKWLDRPRREALEERV